MLAVREHTAAAAEARAGSGKGNARRRAGQRRARPNGGRPPGACGIEAPDVAKRAGDGGRARIRMPRRSAFDADRIRTA
ncbi:hypothetical protein AQ477_30385 [Burkholderia thailandensis]|nr:hypothetical protein AQ477_30385 [Burkholderia thailandensis]KXF57690.1 hypothetical protein AQ476_23285 [Burkholderia thailandensis]PNE77568.1 hypothetical protein A8H37_04330 [Burkholderia thailandensis]